MTSVKPKKQNKNELLEASSVWAERYLMPALKEHADFSCRQAVKYWRTADHFAYLRREQKNALINAYGALTEAQARERYNSEIGGTAPIRFGSDFEIQHDEYRVVVTEWYTTHTGDILNEDRTVADGVYFRQYVANYQAMMNLAKQASESGRKVIVGRCYYPVIHDLNVVWDETKFAWLYHIRKLAEQRVNSVLEVFDRIKADITAEYTPLNEQGLYVGATLHYDIEHDMVQYVVQKQTALSYIKENIYDQDYIDITMDKHGVDATPPAASSISQADNFTSAFRRMLADHVEWERLTKPSKECIQRIAPEIVDLLLEKAADVWESAQALFAEHPHAASAVPGSARFLYSTTNGALRYVYDYIPAGETTPVEEEMMMEVNLRGAIVIVAGRIEPDLWLVVQPLFAEAFAKKYDK